MAVLGVPYAVRREEYYGQPREINLMLAGNVNIIDPVGNDDKIMVTRILIENVFIRSTIATPAAVSFDTGTDGQDIIASTTLTTSTEKKFFFLTPVQTGEVFVITGGRIGRLRKVTLAAGQATTFRARTSNIATLTTGAAHGFAVGDRITVRLVGGTGYNGEVVVLSVPTTTTFTYANTGANEASTADTTGRVGAHLVRVHVYAHKAS